MPRLTDDLDALYAHYVDAINTAISSDDPVLAAELAGDYDRDALLLMAEHEGRPDLLPLFGLDSNGGTLTVQRDTRLRRLVAKVAALGA
jgi:hypothetical protein